MSEREHFNAVVVGSGFGGSVMAYRLAEADLSVCLLERGKPYPPGSFARSPREMRDNFWNPSQGQHGLFQVWSFGGIDGLVSAGLGGGSLIYANVLIRKDERWFVRRGPDGTPEDWPITRADLDPHYDNVEAMLAPHPYPFDHPPYSRTPKTRAFKEAAEKAGLDWSLPNLAVTFGDLTGPPIPGEPIRDANGATTDNLHGRTRTTCRLCGECDVGCNYGSKNTLDYNYLTQSDKLGVQVRDRCEVRWFAPRPEGGYLVRYVIHRDEDEGSPTDTKHLPLVEVTADRLVLSAGTFGSTFLLLKNRRHFPKLSGSLGHFFSGNGDFLGLVHNAHQTVDGLRTARELAPSHGTVITSTVRIPDTRDGGSGPGYYVQDGGYPVSVDWLAEASNVAGLLHRALRIAERRLLGRLTHRPQIDLDGELEGLIGDAHRSAGLLPLLGMGLDTPDGVMSLDDRGYLALDWSANHSSEYFGRVIGTMKELAKELDADLQVDPLWYLRKKVITVHPVGGCSMGRDRQGGVVDTNGEVFGYPGFVVADGSVMPGPVGPNPSLTIAALSDRFAEHQIRVARPAAR
jgi:cholesterol oxidase